MNRGIDCVTGVTSNAFGLQPPWALQSTSRELARHDALLIPLSKIKVERKKRAIPQLARGYNLSGVSVAVA
jgi:hypothetical protein